MNNELMCHPERSEGYPRSKIPLVALLLGVTLSACTSEPIVAPESPPSVALPGLDPLVVPPKQVTIYRDTWGVPHIYADTEAAGFYALGYAEAQDQLEKIIGGQLWIRGRLAEVLGDGALPGDIETRRWMNFDEGTKGFARLSPQLQTDYRAFVAGVKQFIAENPKGVPPGMADLITPESLTAVTRQMYFNFYNVTWGTAECSKEGVKRQLLATNVDNGGWPDVTRASNEWAVLPSRTANGETILLGDPHVDVNNPVYYEYRMNAGDFHSTGFAALAMLWQSQNDHVAWAFTTGHPDMWDCYAVDTDPANLRQYQYDSKVETMEVRKETFTSSSGKVVTQEFEYTHHNGVLSPVVRRDGNVAYVLSQSQMNDGGLLDDEIYRMNRAASVKELREALKTLGMFAQNLMAVDDGGHGYYLHAGKTPRRPDGYDWSKPVPGNTSKTAWLGFHPLEEMIEIMDPPQGYMTNNNVSPDVMFADGNIDAKKYPKYAFYDTPGRNTTRGVRALEVLSKADKFTVDDAKALVFDEKWTTAAPMQVALRAAAKSQWKYMAKLGKDARTMVTRIDEFDGFAHAESAAALNFWFWRDELGRTLEKPEFKAFKEFPWPAKKITPAFARAMLDAAAAGAAAQIKAVGDLDPPMGKLFRAGRGGPNGKSWPLGGESILSVPGEDCLWHVTPQCDRTLRAFGSSPPDKNGERLAMRGSQSTRLVVFGNGKRETWTSHAYGEQQIPGPHFDDQAQLMSEKKLKPAWMDKDELMQHVESTKTLDVPEGF